jgi:hypothetical protein
MRTFVLAAAMTAAVLAAGAQAQDQSERPRGAPAEITTEELVSTFNAKLARGEDIAGQIGAMAARDTFLREVMIDGFHRPMGASTRQAYIDATRDAFEARGKANSDALKAILDHISWTELAALSPQTARQAWLLISHSPDDDFKRRMIAIFEPLARNGSIPGSDYANLVDDVRMDEGRPQLYGTNYECRDGVYQPKPTEDMATLNARRAALGMETIEKSTEIMRQMYGECPKGYSGN